MRNRLLLASVARQLAPDEQPIVAAMMWRRAPWAWLAAVGAGSAAGLFAFAVVEPWPTRLGVIAAAVVVAVAAGTEWRVVAAVADSSRPVLLRGSRIRSTAVALVERLPSDVHLARTGGSAVSSEWSIGDERYTLRKHSDKAMNHVVEALKAAALPESP